MLIQPVNRKEFVERTFPHVYDVLVYQEGGHYYAKDSRGNVICADSPSACIQESVNYIQNGGKIFIKNGTYYINSTINIGSKDKMSAYIYIDGSKPVLVPTGDFPMFNITNITQSLLGNIYIYDINNVVSRNNFAIIIDSISYTELFNISIHNYGSGLLLKSSIPYNTTRMSTLRNIRIMQPKFRGIEVWANVHDTSFQSISVESPGENGIVFDHTLNELPDMDISGGNQMTNIIVLLAGGIGIYIVDWWELFATNVITDSNELDGLNITSVKSSPQRLFFYNLWSSMNKGIGIHLNGSSGYPIQDVYIYGISRFNSVGVQSSYANAYMALMLSNNNTQTNISNSNIIIKGLNTENSGQASIPANATSVTVNHGLICAPRKVLVTPLAQPPGSIWVSNITATSFNINVSAAPATDLPVAWYAEC